MEEFTIEPKIKKGKSFKESILDFTQSVVIALTLCAFLFIFIITPNEVEGNSMLPNYYTGDRLYTNKLTYWLGNSDFGKQLGLNYQRGDVVVVDKPGMNLSLIKRIIGLPGERIRLVDGYVYINGEKLNEFYLEAGMRSLPGTFLQQNDEKVIPNDNFFVMGDNRTVSNDSRYIGFINERWISGRIFLRIWPLDKAGLTGSLPQIDERVKL